MSASAPSPTSSAATKLAWEDTTPAQTAKAKIDQSMKRLQQMFDYDHAELSKFAQSPAKSEGETESFFSKRVFTCQAHTASRPMTAPAKRQIETDQKVSYAFCIACKQVVTIKE